MNPRRVGAAGLHGAALGQCLLYFGILGNIQRITQHGNLAALLLGKRQPAFKFGIQLGFAVQINRAMQQRARAGYPKVVTKTLFGCLQLGQCVFQIAAPYVTTVHQPQRQHFISWQTIQNGMQLIRGTHQVHVQTFHGQADSQTQVVFQAAEIGGDQLLQR